MSEIKQEEGICPNCHIKMSVTTPFHYHCDNCKNDFNEKAICPTCGKETRIISGCGAINYLCDTDGLVSSKKIQFIYQPA